MVALRRVARRTGAALAVGGVVLLTASCAAGQHAATAAEVPTIDGAFATLGSIQLNGVAIHAPLGTSYAAGSIAPLAAVIANNGDSSDTLTRVSSPAYSGWAIVSTTSVASTQVTTTGTPTSIPAGSSLSLGLRGLGAATPNSTRTLVLASLASKSSPLYPGGSVKVTFTFAKSGSTTLTVPVQLSTTPNQATIPAPSGESNAG